MTSLPEILRFRHSSPRDLDRSGFLLVGRECPQIRIQESIKSQLIRREQLPRFTYPGYYKLFGLFSNWESNSQLTLESLEFPRVQISLDPSDPFLMPSLGLSG